MSRAPRSLFVPEVPAPFLTRDESLALGHTVQGYMTAPDNSLAVSADVVASTEFAQNQILRGTDSVSQSVAFDEFFDRRHVGMTTDQLDDTSLHAAVAKAETLAQSLHVLAAGEPAADPLRAPGAVSPRLWSDSALVLVQPEGRLAAVDMSLSSCRAAGLEGAGWVSASPYTTAVMNKAGHFEYGQKSVCRYSLTVRTPDGTGSGWAGWEGQDWSTCDVHLLTERAIDLAQRSKNPVAIEPGRYTVVMTADACGALVALIATGFDGAILGGTEADDGGSPFSKPGGGNKIGLKVLDERVSLSTDPMDPDGGFLPFGYAYHRGITQYVPVTWVDHGILKTLSYPTRAAAAAHGLDQVNNTLRLRMSGGPTSIEEMIASTTRGIFVNSFSDVNGISRQTMFMTGVTRDGTFLIEKGKITKPIKNLRFEDSPFFFLNNLEAIGPARRVAYGHVMPPIKVRDFAFTSLTDAV
jgi:predicted Zn-dependent protease